MNNKEIAEQLFETKFIKALYNTSLERSFINKIIAEELLREADKPEPVPIDSILTNLNNALAAIKKEGDDPVENMIELFMLAAKIEAVYLPKFVALQNKGVKGFDDRTLEELDSFKSVVQGLAGSLTLNFGFRAFLDVYEKGVELNKEDIATELRKIPTEKLEKLYKKLQPTAVKAFNNVIRDIDKEEKTQDITDRSTAVTEMRRIVSRAKGSIQRLESFVEQVKQKLGKEFSKYGKLNAFIKNEIEPIKQRTREFLEKFEQRKDEIEQELANLRTVKEERAATPELIQELVNEWSGIQKEISEVFDKLRDKGLYEKGEVDDAGETALPKVTLESESLAEMLAHAFAYENDKNAEKIYEVLQSKGTGFLSALGAATKKAFNEEDQKDEGPSQEQKEKFISSKKIFAKFEPEIALAFAVRHKNNFSIGTENLKDAIDNPENEEIRLNFKESDLNNDDTSIAILKILLKNNRKLEGIQYDIERKLRQGEWSPSVYEELLNLPNDVLDVTNFGNSLIVFLQKIYMVDYDPKSGIKTSQLRRDVVQMLRELRPNVPEADINNESNYYTFDTLKNLEFLEILKPFLEGEISGRKEIKRARRQPSARKMKRAVGYDKTAKAAMAKAGLSPSAQRRKLDPLDENDDVEVKLSIFNKFAKEPKSIKELEKLNAILDNKLSKHLVETGIIDKTLSDKIFKPSPGLSDIGVGVGGKQRREIEDKIKKGVADGSITGRDMTILSSNLKDIDFDKDIAMSGDGDELSGEEERNRMIKILNITSEFLETRSPDLQILVIDGNLTQRAQKTAELIKQINKELKTQEYQSGAKKAISAEVDKTLEDTAQALLIYASQDDSRKKEFQRLARKKRLKNQKKQRGGDFKVDYSVGPPEDSETVKKRKRRAASRASAPQKRKSRKRAAQFKKNKQRQKQLDKTNRVANRGGRTLGPGDESMYLEESIEKLIYLMLKEYKAQKEP